MDCHICFTFCAFIMKVYSKSRAFNSNVRHFYDDIYFYHNIIRPKSTSFFQNGLIFYDRIYLDSYASQKMLFLNAWIKTAVRGRQMDCWVISEIGCYNQFAVSHVAKNHGRTGGCIAAPGGPCSSCRQPTHPLSHWPIHAALLPASSSIFQ